jgi:acyl-CoA dehydrogenase
MDLSLSESQRELVDLAEQFAKNEIAPIASQCDQSQSIPQDFLKKAQELGLSSITIPEEYGGVGLPYLDFVLATEKMSWGCVALAGSLCLNSMMVDAIKLAGNPEQKKTYLSRLASGEFASYCMTEPAAGSDAAGIKTTAKKKGDHYILNGSKTWISQADLASFFIVFAKTDTEAGHKGISAFLVERSAAGLSVGKKLPKMGQRAGAACEVFFENIELSKSALLGLEGKGFKLAMQVFDHSRPMVAAFGVGLAARALDEALEYAKTRHSMGKPIAHHQAVAHKIAEMGIRLEASKLLTYQSAALLDKGQRNTLQASYAKTYASETAVYNANEGLQIFGGMGYSTEYPMEKLYRDAKVLQIYEGTTEIQKSIIAKELLRGS